MPIAAEVPTRPQVESATVKAANGKRWVHFANVKVRRIPKEPAVFVDQSADAVAK